MPVAALPASAFCQERFSFSLRQNDRSNLLLAAISEPSGDST